MSIEVQHLSKTFGQFKALDDVSLRVAPGELMALLGPSGSGKTTLLRIIAGLEFGDPGSGAVLFHGEEVTDCRASERGAGFVFQHYALFRHLNVFENVAFGLRVQPRKTRPPENRIREKVASLLDLVQIGELSDRFPTQLSGGQRQPRAVSRDQPASLAAEPKVLLLDEPFGALDAQVRKELRRWLRRLHRDLHVTSLFVTHDQDEALEVADRIVVMNAGRIEQVGTPAEVYDHPANPFVYNFLGNVNLFRGRIQGGRVHLGDAQFSLPEYAARMDVAALAYVRPHDMELVRQSSHRGGTLSAVVRELNGAGPSVRVELTRCDDGTPFEVQLTKERHIELALQPGERIFVELHNLRVFADDYSI
jgi:sulfate transport system ATP-binding protein